MLFTPFAFMAESGGYTPTDADALAYISEVETQGGTLSTTDKEAIDNLYIGLKADGLYSKIKYMYPFMGGTADSHAVEGVQPTDADYTITWSGGLTSSLAHTSAGVDSTISTGVGVFARTPAEIHSSVNDVSFGAYVSSALPNGANFIIGTDVTSNRRYQMNIAISTDEVYVGIGNSNFALYVNGSEPIGTWIGSRTSSTLVTIYKNGSSVATETTSNAGATLAIADIGLFSLPNGTNPFDGVTGLIFGADGFDATEAANMTSRIETLMTAIGR